MTSRQLYKAVLIELNKKNAPNILLELFNYFANKAINNYVNKRYNIYDINQLTTDDLRVLKSSAVLTPTKVSSYNELSTTGDMASYEVILPSDYLHILNCICIYKVKKTYECFNAGTYWRSPAKRLTADMYSLVLDNFWNKPNYDNPYYYIHNVNTSSTNPTNPYNGVSGTDISVIDIDLIETATLGVDLFNEGTQGLVYLNYNDSKYYFINIKEKTTLGVDVSTVNDTTTYSNMLLINYADNTKRPENITEKDIESNYFTFDDIVASTTNNTGYNNAGERYDEPTNTVMDEPATPGATPFSRLSKVSLSVAKKYILNLPKGTISDIDAVKHLNDSTELVISTANDDAHGNSIISVRQGLPTTINILGNNYSNVQRTGEVRYGNVSQVRMEIRYGSDTRVFQLEKVLVDYIKAPQLIRLTQEHIDFTEDYSQMLEYPDYVCQEIINELVNLIMENISDQRLQTFSVVSLSIANPAQALTPDLAVQPRQ